MSDLVGNPEDRFCRDAAHLISLLVMFVVDDTDTFTLPSIRLMRP